MYLRVTWGGAGRSRAGPPGLSPVQWLAHQGVARKEQVLSGALGASIRKLVKGGIVNPEKELGGTQEEEGELRLDGRVGSKEKARQEPDTLMSS